MSKKRNILNRNILNSIRFKLLFSFIIVIIVLSLQTVYLAKVHFQIVEQYKEASDNLILENKFTEYVPEFIQSYYNLINTPNSQERLYKYNQLHNEIEETFSKLDNAIISEDSKITYRGLKNYIMNIINSGDEGVKDIQAGRLIESIRVYENMINKQSFLIENTGNLILKDISYAEELQKKIEQTHKNTINLMLILIFFITSGCVLFVLFFAKKITDPIINLSKIATRISEGNLKLNVSKNLLEKKDEIGTLSNSFDTMLKRINAEIESQKKISNDLVKSRKDLENRNEELEKFNRMVIGRELKMVELKKKIKELEEKLQKK
ncbi:hypothetical protein COV14_02450 [Candidatus Woesearchaeota archaeon CG10_big_fil_rev_8_21_14_0_10_33_12]|nr:MAG: hypothetical protein COV14_02450 [Candidatus Woesearchaeota archaeon CG10_big_fil_rev_8_21_14_0_10_33_12]